jgi:short-subunit dehydrogenase
MRTLVITGGSSGIGKATASLFAERGWRVFELSRRESKAESRKTKAGGEIIHVPCDVSSEESTREAVRQVLAQTESVDVVISNAGFGISGPVEFTDIKEAEHQMDVNFMGMVRLLNLVIPIMRNQRKGHIICISSIGGLMGLPYQGMYSASKFAIEGYCESLRLELRRFNVNVTVINPGDFSTGFTSQRGKVCCPEALTAYPGYSRSMQSIEHDENTGLKPDLLARRISRIVHKRHPRNSYIIATPVQKASVLLKRILPSRWFDRILGSYYRL